MVAVEVPGTELREIRIDEDAFAALIERELAATARTVTGSLGQVIVARADPDAVTPDDVNGIITEWQRRLTETIMPWLEGFVAANVVAQQVAINAVFGDQVLVAIDEDLITRLILGGAENRLVRIGDDLWTAARASLAAGVDAGESIPRLAQRVVEAADVATPRATVIARTEVIGTSNKSSIEVMRASGVVAQKEWIATFDDRVRPTHIAAHAQVVNLDEPFSVGVAELDHPGDFAGPAEEVINCRCAMGYVVDEDVEDEPITAAARDHSDGAMIALIPTEEDAARLAVNDGEHAEELHLTLAYLGKASDWSEKDRRALVDALTVASWPVASGSVAFGFAHWNPGGHSPCWVLNVGGDGVDAAHRLVEETLSSVSGLPVPGQHRPWAAHVCLTYTDDTTESLVEALKERVGEVVFDRVRVAFGGKKTDIPI